MHYREEKTVDLFDSEPVNEPVVAVVIPVYKHSVLLVEAIESAINQVAPFKVHVVIVDDGCPHQETIDIAKYYARHNPGITYLRKSNGGLSSARNAGIDFVVEHFSSVDSFFFLDADNRLLPSSLAKAHYFLNNERVDWVYPSIDKFGICWYGNYSTRYSRLLHVCFDNICEAGSLVSRRIIDAGVRFDEEMKEGFEDWDFWLQAIGKGFEGRNLPDFGFQYRQRAESMIKESNRVRSSILYYLRKKHRKLFQISTLLHWEHSEVPRFAFFSTDSDEIRQFTDPLLDHRSVTNDEFIQMYGAESSEPETFGTPPFWIWGRYKLFKSLLSSAVCHCILWQLQRALESIHFVQICIENDDDTVSLHWSEHLTTDPSDGPIHFWATRQSLFRECVADPSDEWIKSILTGNPGPRIARMTVRLPVDRRLVEQRRRGATALMFDTLEELRQELGGGSKRWIWRISDQLPRRGEYFRLLENAAGASPVMPRAGVAGKRQIGFALPLVAFGGVEKVLLSVAEVLSEERDFDCHLYIVGDTKAQLSVDLSSIFRSITFFSEKDLPSVGGPSKFFGHNLLTSSDIGDVSRRALGCMSGLDALIVSHTAGLNAVLGELRKTGTYLVNYLHVLDQTTFGRQVGHPYVSLAFEHVFDLFVSCSQNLRDWLNGMGVPDDKIIVMDNAPGYNIDPVFKDSLLSKRCFAAPERELRVLFLGRLDTQKGVERLYDVVNMARQKQLSVCWRIIGSSVITDGFMKDWHSIFAGIGLNVEPAVYDSSVLSQALAESDILLLPSRWEGAPLTVLEAQRLGCVPMVTDVGAVNELIDHDVDGIIVKSASELDIVNEIVAYLSILSSDKTLLRRLSQNACRRVENVSWRSSARPLMMRLRSRFI